jgi:uncharacterized repeat protein (TIGR03803 family)/VCBS repeat-containing protein
VNGYGTVFEIAKTATGYASTPTTLVSFNGPPIGPDGSYPFGTLIADAKGNLFGTTISGGAYSFGTVFEIAKTATGYASTPTILVNFNGTNGDEPLSGLIADANGDLFGTTVYGGEAYSNALSLGYGTVFEIAKTATGYSSTPTTLVSFNDTNGNRPVGNLTADAAGDLFGTTIYGGTYSGPDGAGYGTVFEIVKTATGYASTPTTLANFNGTDGYQPRGDLIADAAGNLFGMTLSGGAYSFGTVFEIVKTAHGYASTPTTLVSFNGTDGGNPLGGLIADAAGNLFDMTESGGAYGDGTVFEIAKTATGYASTPTILVNFNGTNGLGAIGGLIVDANGDLFGTTSGGGAHGDGTVFEITDSGFVVAPPTVQADRAHVQEGNSITEDAAHGVLANDTDPIPNDTLFVSAVDGVASDVGHSIGGTYGTLMLNADGSYSYLAHHSVPSDIIAQDIFTYTASDGIGGSATSTLTITITQPGQTYIAGTPGEPLTSGNGSVFLDGSLLENQTITAGNDKDAVLAGSNDTVSLGNGADVVSAGDSDTISLGNGPDSVTAGANSTVTLGNGNDAVTAGSNSTIKLCNGNDAIYVGLNATVTVGTGHDSFVFQQTTPGNIGAVTVTGFDPNKDSFTFSNQLTTSVSYHDNVQGNAVVTVDHAGDTITLLGVHSAELHPSDFHFVDPAALPAAPSVAQMVADLHAHGVLV